MSKRRIAAVFLRQYYITKGSISRVLPLFLWIVIDMVLWGFITKYLSTVASSPFSFVQMFLGAVLLWDFCTRVMQGVTMTFFEDVWSRNFLNLFASPLAISEYVVGLVLCSIAGSSIGLTTMVLLSYPLFGLSFASYGILLIPFLMILFLFGIAMGVFLCGIVLRFGPAAEWFVWPIPMLLAPLVGVFYPVSVLPRWMRLLSHGLPPSYVFEGLRAIVSRSPVPSGALAWGAGLAILYILLACWFFTRVYRQAVRSGLIARYSAESLS